MAAVRTGSPKISLHRSKDRFLVMIVDFLPALSERWLNSTIRKYTKAKTVIPDDQVALKAVYLAIAIAEKKWTFPVRDRGSVINHLIIKSGDRCGVL